jgi:hypothetical protein
MFLEFPYVFLTSDDSKSIKNFLVWKQKLQGSSVMIWHMDNLQFLQRILLLIAHGVIVHSEIV